MCPFSSLELCNFFFNFSHQYCGEWWAVIFILFLWREHQTNYMAGDLYSYYFQVSFANLGCTGTTGFFEGCISPLILITRHIFISYPGNLYCLRSVNAPTTHWCLNHLDIKVYLWQSKIFSARVLLFLWWFSLFAVSSYWLNICCRWL